MLNLRQKGVKVGLFKPISLFPMCVSELYKIAKKFQKLLICELNLGQYAGEVVKVTARNDFCTLFKVNGRPISPAEIEKKLGECYGV